MLAGLRHHAVVAGHHQQCMVNTADARQHIGEEFLVAGHVDKTQHPAVRLWPVGVTQIDGHAAAFSSGRRSALIPEIACSRVVLP